MDFQHDPIFQVDFNHFDDEGRFLKASVWHGSSRRFPRRGERALLIDADGNRCEAVVRDVRNVIVFFEIDNATWVSGERTETTTFGDDVTHDWSAVKSDPV